MTVVGIILIVIGLSALTGISFGGFIVAVILIAIGIRMIAGRSIGGPASWRWHDYDHDHNHGDDGTNQHGHHYHVSSEERSIDEVAVFSPLNKTFTADQFKGGRIVMVFSGGEIDLSQVKTDKTEIDLEVSSVFSSIEITVPKDWNVKSKTNVFAGSVDLHQAQGGQSTGGVTLTIHGDAVFGEIEVRK